MRIFGRTSKYQSRHVDRGIAYDELNCAERKHQLGRAGLGIKVCNVVLWYSCKRKLNDVKENITENVKFSRRKKERVLNRAIRSLFFKYIYIFAHFHSTIGFGIIFLQKYPISHEVVTFYFCTYEQDKFACNRNYYICICTCCIYGIRI